MQPAAPSELQPGQTLGGYTIESVIAAGGMGTVYRARKAMLDKTVALKVLHAAIAPEQDNLARFFREAKVAANLDHPAVIKVSDVGQDQGRHYMAMEYVDGRDLKSLVTEHGPFSPRKALRIIRQIAEVLAYAHDKGLIHRDVKPANILITEKNEAKLGDFGLARLSREDHEVTMAGTILGTPAFMSPEQCRGDALDGRTDLYSLGATLYFLLSGKVPFAGDNPTALIHRVINEPPPPLKQLAPDVPESVVVLVQRLMAKLPDMRFADGHEVVAAIDDALIGRSAAHARPAEPALAAAHADIPWGKIVLGAGAAALVVIGTYFLAGKSGEADASGWRPPPRVPFANRTEGAADPRPEGDAARADDAGAADAAFQAEFEDLQEETTRFVELLSAGALGKIDDYLDAGLGSSVKKREAVKSLLDTVAARRMESVKYRTQQRGWGKAKTVLVFSNRGTGESISYTVFWTREEDDWYVDTIVEGDESR